MSQLAEREEYENRLLGWFCPVLLVASAAFADSSFDLKVAADKSNIAVHLEGTGGSADGKNLHVKLVDKGGKKFTIIGEKGPIGILKIGCFLEN